MKLHQKKKANLKMGSVTDSTYRYTSNDANSPNQGLVIVILLHFHHDINCLPFDIHSVIDHRAN